MPPVPRLTASDLVLEPLTADSAAAILAGDLSALTPGAGWPHDDTLDGLRGIAEDRSFGWLVTLHGTVIGDCGVHGTADPSGEIEIGYGLAAPYRGRGHGTTTVAAITRYLLSRAEVRRVVAGTDPGNVPSRRVLDSVGFVEVGMHDGEVRYAIEPVSILLISGSTRAASTNTAALRTAAALAPVGVHARMYPDLADLPAFNPDADRDPATLPRAVQDLRQAIDAADGVLLSTPEYAGTLPGSFKNLLDWTVGGAQLYEKPVAVVNVAAPGRGEGAQATLATVLGYVAAAVDDEAGARVYVPREAVGPDGFVEPDDLRDELSRRLAVFARGLRRRRL